MNRLVMLGVLLAGVVWTGEGAVTRSVCTNSLTTSWGVAVTPENAWREYPRPQLVRPEWTSLNGNWDYAVTDVVGDGPQDWDGTILVPYPIESPLSGVRRRVSPEEQIWYRRSFVVQPRRGFRTILNFERVDFRASVFVNGQEALDVPHEGGNVPFAVDVTDFVKAGENELRVLVWDPTDTHLGGAGKQSLELWTCFFGPCSGICGGVWMETVPETYLADYQVLTDVDAGTVTIVPELKGRAHRAEVEVAVSFGGTVLATKSARGGEAVTVALPAPRRLWSCDTPNLYDLAITVRADGRSDAVTGYFGLRKVETKLDARGHRRVAINGEFTYLLATLDQGWWPDGLLTPPSEAACRFDVDFHKKAGFTAIRKHIKIEPRVFYAHCDRIGMMVLQDIPSVGLDRCQDRLVFANARYGFARRELKDCVDLLRNHPSIVVWIPYNEGWGQPSADKTRMTNKWLRRYDPTRLIDGPSGWNDYEGGTVRSYAKWSYADAACGDVFTDFVDLHHYPDASMHPARGRRVSFLGEFGGMGVNLQGHVQDPKGGVHALRPVEDPSWREEQQARYASLMKPLPDLIRNGLGGSVYTEAVDQFWELGGFVTFDRALVKLDYAFLRKIHQDVLDVAREAARTPPPQREPGFFVDWTVSPALDQGEWPRVRVLADGRWAFSYSRRKGEKLPAASAVVRYSSDAGRTWARVQTVMGAFERSDGAGGTVVYSICNPELMQIPDTSPIHPGRLVASANLRPRQSDRSAPSSIGVTVSDDAGRSWRPFRALLPVAGDAEVKGGRGCWEPFVVALPDGTLHLYYTDISPVGTGASVRNVSRFVSRDGGDSWQGPKVVISRSGEWNGIPSAILHGDAIYVAHEGHPVDCPDGVRHPFIQRFPLADVETAAGTVCDPFAKPLGRDEFCGAPYLVQTENFLVLSAQGTSFVPKEDPLRWTKMRVWVMPKSAVGADGGLREFRPVANPMGDLMPMHWNGLAPLGGDELLATCQRGADLFLVRGRIRSRP